MKKDFILWSIFQFILYLIVDIRKNSAPALKEVFAQLNRLEKSFKILCTPEPQFSKPLFSKYLDLLNKLKLPYSYITILAPSI